MLAALTVATPPASARKMMTFLAFLPAPLAAGTIKAKRRRVGMIRIASTIQGMARPQSIRKTNPLAVMYRPPWLAVKRYRGLPFFISSCGRSKRPYRLRIQHLF